MQPTLHHVLDCAKHAAPWRMRVPKRGFSTRSSIALVTPRFARKPQGTPFLNQRRIIVRNNATSSTQPLSRRCYSQDVSKQQDKYAAVVVGGGPAGITVIGNLLERKLQPILWVDDKFEAGRVNRSYREVPSNTKTKLFIDFAEAVEPFRKIIDETPSPHAVDSLRKLEQDQGCNLSHAADMLLMLTDGLKTKPELHSRLGRVSEATLDDTKGWNVQLKLADNTEAQVASDRLVLCTGSSPNDTPLPVVVEGMQPLHLDTALSPTVLAKSIPRDSPATIAVIGASHSAILVLLNLYNLAKSTHPQLRIKWFTRHALRYAEYMDGWILRDNTGLKGAAAAWARANLEPDAFEDSDVSKFVTPIHYKRENEFTTYEEHLPGCQYYVTAIGYNKDPLPTLRKGNETLTPYYNHMDGSFSTGPGEGEGEKIKGLYGAGIAWPQRVTDPQGNVEYAVGFWKFMKFVKSVVGKWD